MFPKYAILVTCATEGGKPECKVFEQPHEGYTEYKKLVLENKVDCELVTSGSGRVARHRVFGPKVNFKAAQPVEEQPGTNDFKAAKQKSETRAELKRRAAEAQKKIDDDLAAARKRRRENAARTELSGSTATELRKIAAVENVAVAAEASKADVINAILVARKIIDAPTPAKPDADEAGPADENEQ